MPDTAATRLSRIVSLVADLTRRVEQGEEPPTLDSLATMLDVSVAEILRDVRTLTLLGEHAEAEWLLSLSVWQQEDRLAVSSAGSFRRPIRLSPEEMLAIQIALAMDPEGPAIAKKLLPLIGASAPQVAASGATPDFYGLIAAAIAVQRPVELLYAGEGQQEGERWVIQAHQLVRWRGRSYVVAWCESVADWRHFRVDRILDALETEGHFERRSDFVPVTTGAGLFRPGEAAPDEVRVRFSPRIARWAREHYSCDELPDGSVIATLQASGTDWLVRRVLEYGDDAEVVEPEAYRDAVRRAVA